MLPADLTVSEAMRFSGYTRCHIYNLVTAERLKTRRAKMRAGPLVILIDRTSLEEYMRGQGRAINGATTNNR